jgi:2-phosphoglycerate kinase
VIATDVIRQVLRAFFTHDAMPSVHYSAFDVGGVEGYLTQAQRVGTGVAAIVERAATERKPIMVEGVHVLPGELEPDLRARCVVAEALLVVNDAELHRGHLSARPGTRPAERYLANFDAIRQLQDHLAERARKEGVAVIANENMDETLTALMALVLDAVGRLREMEPEVT